MDDGDVAFDNYDRSDDEDESIEYKELDLAALSLAAQEVFYLFINLLTIR